MFSAEHFATVFWQQIAPCIIGIAVTPVLGMAVRQVDGAVCACILRRCQTVEDHHDNSRNRNSVLVYDSRHCGQNDLSGAIKSEYVFFAGERCTAGYQFGSFLLFADHMKTASAETDASGNIKDESDFYPWGGELQFTNNNDNHYKFTGKERDSEFQLDHFGARYYGNALGRFISADWSGAPVPVP
jgi:RHS repeat-associated protein